MAITKSQALAKIYNDFEKDFSKDKIIDYIASALGENYRNLIRKKVYDQHILLLPKNLSEFFQQSLIIKGMKNIYSQDADDIPFRQTCTQLNIAPNVAKVILGIKEGDVEKLYNYNLVDTLSMFFETDIDEIGEFSREDTLKKLTELVSNFDEETIQTCRNILAFNQKETSMTIASNEQRLSKIINSFTLYENDYPSSIKREPGESGLAFTKKHRSENIKLCSSEFLQANPDIINDWVKIFLSTENDAIIEDSDEHKLINDIYVEKFKKFYKEKTGIELTDEEATPNLDLLSTIKNELRVYNKKAELKEDKSIIHAIVENLDKETAEILNNDFEGFMDYFSRNQDVIAFSKSSNGKDVVVYGLNKAMSQDTVIHEYIHGITRVDQKSGFDHLPQLKDFPTGIDEATTELITLDICEKINIPDCQIPKTSSLGCGYTKGMNLIRTFYDNYKEDIIKFKLTPPEEKEISNPLKKVFKKKSRITPVFESNTFIEMCKKLDQYMFGDIKSATELKNLEEEITRLSSLLAISKNEKSAEDIDRRCNDFLSGQYSNPGNLTPKE